MINLSDVELPSNRKFGFFFTALFLIAAVYSFYTSSQTWLYALSALGVAFFTVTLVRADVFLPLNKLWMRLGLLLGMIFSPIVMGLVFFVMFTPVAICMRLFGRDELRLRFKQRTSHWTRRDVTTQSDSFKYQF